MLALAIFFCVTLAFCVTTQLFLFVSTLFVWGGLMVYALRKPKERSVLMCYLIAFFMLLLGRDVLQWYFSYKPERYEWEILRHTYLVLFLSLMTTALTVMYLNSNLHIYVKRYLRTRGILPQKRKQVKPYALLQKQNAWHQDLWQSSLIVYYIVGVAGWASKAFTAFYVYQNGYYKYYQHYVIYRQGNTALYLLEKIDLMFPLVFCVVLALYPTKKQLIKPIGFYLFYNFTALLTGQRFPTLSAMLLLVAYAMMRSDEVHWGKHIKKTLALAVVVVIALVALFSLMESLRGTQGSNSSGGLVDFLYGQGVSVNVIKKSYYIGHKLPQDKFYSLSFLYSGIFAKLFGIPVYHGNTIENALHGSSFSHALTYVYDKALYLKGAGYGSSYLAEAYFDFSYLGVVVWSSIYGALVFVAGKLKKGQVWRNAAKLLIISTIIWAPRGPASGFLVSLLAPSTLGGVAIIIGLAVALRKVRTLFRGELFRNISYTLIANVASMVIMGVLTFLIPKVTNSTQYSYWALYLLYSQYIGYLTFGVTDGLYVKYGGYRYHDLPKAHAAFQFKLLFFLHIISSVFFLAIYLPFAGDVSYSLIAVATCVSGLLYVPRTLITMCFQATNKLREYSAVIIFERLSLLLLIVGLIAAQQTNFEAFILSDLASKLLTLLLAVWLGKELVFARSPIWHEAIGEFKECFTIGIQIVIANFSSILINGIVRFFIQQTWGLETFGYVSFSFSLANVLMTMIMAVSIVFFPYLKRLEKRHYAQTYRKISVALIAVVGLIMLLYFPLKAVLDVWLPRYQMSIKYLALLFPLCLFESRFKLLINNYYKAMRLETLLMQNNIVSVLLTIVLCLFTAQVLQSLDLTVFVILLVLAIRCIVGEIYLSQCLRLRLGRDLIQLVLLSTSFIMATWFLPMVFAALVYGGTFGAFVFANRRRFKFGKI